MQVSKSAYLEKMRPVMRALIDALNKRFTSCSVLAQDTRGKSYRVSGNGISAAEDRLFSGRGFVVRAADERGFAEYSFDRLSMQDIPAIVEKMAQELMPLAPGYATDALTDALCGDSTRLNAASEYEIHPEDMGDSAILTQLSEIRAAGLAHSEKVLDCIANVSYQQIHKLFLSAQKELEQNLLWTNGSVAVLASRGQELKYSAQSYSKLGGAEIMRSMLQDVARVADVTIELLDSEPMVPGVYDCVCTPEVTGMIVHEAFGHGVEMDMFVKDRALAKSYIGKQVASSLVTMHDGAAAVEETGSYFFDDEGILAHDTVIIEKGILKRGISDLLSARSLGTEPTGNGRRESFERKAYTRMTNTYFEGGTDKVEDMIASIDYGFLLEQPSSGMEDPKNWGIQCMVNIAREIKDGKLTGKIFSPIVLTGYVPDLLKSISMMSENVSLGGSGVCGKGYKEWVKVSDGGPYIKAKICLG